jgi:hypothetical protein
MKPVADVTGFYFYIWAVSSRNFACILQRLKRASLTAPVIYAGTLKYM